MDQTTATNLSGKKIKDTYKGVLHFDSELQTDEVKFVYDGVGNKTALSLGKDSKNAIINGDLQVLKTITVYDSSLLLANLSVGGDINLQNGGNINDLQLKQNNDPVTVRALNTAEVGKLRIRETTSDYELIFGNPTLANSNLFSIIVKNDNNNNLYIKNDYSAPDVTSPLWIDKSTGSVNIANLNVGSINTLNTGAGGSGGTPNANRNTVPVGAVMMFTSLTIPQGWLECDGSEQLISDYTDLHALIQQTFKTNNSLDTTRKFQLPDLRGLFVRGWDNTKGIDSGRTFGTIQDDTFQGHSHNMASGSYSTEDTPPNRTVTMLAGDDNPVLDATHNQSFSYEYIQDPKTIATYGTVRIGNETRPKNLALIYCIKW